MSASLGSEIVGFWQDEPRWPRVGADGHGADLAFGSDAVGQCLRTLGAADRVFQRSGPSAGIAEVAIEMGAAEKDAAALFSDDEDLRAAYASWAYGAVLDEIGEAIEVTLESDGHEWGDCLRSIWLRFRHHALNFCQFGWRGAASVSLFRRTVDLMAIFFEHGAGAGACDVPDVQLAAFRCVDLLTRPLHWPSWRPEMTLDPLPSTRVREASRADDEEWGFVEFLAGLSPFVRAVERSRYS